MFKLLKTALLSLLTLFFLSVAYVLIFDVTDPGSKETGPSQLSVTGPLGKSTTGVSQNVTEQQSLYEMAQIQTLGWYRKLSKKERQEVVANMYARTDTNGSADDFYSMMGDMAYNKSQTLKFADVWRWCVNEAELNPERFKSHLNPMEEKDLSDKAYSACQEKVKANIIAPFSAVFPNKYHVITHGHDRYTIVAYVDSQNQYGAMIRMNWSCNANYKYGSWESEIKFEER